jgi:hypothetical protein
MNVVVTVALEVLIPLIAVSLILWIGQLVEPSAVSQPQGQAFGRHTSEEPSNV